MALWFADSLVLATDPQKRSLHDRLAGTIVRQEGARPAPCIPLTAGPAGCPEVS